jgi:glutaredoxin
MKKWALIFAVFLLYQNWGKIDRYLNPPPPRSTQDEIVLYTTSWCGYCKMTREFFAQNQVKFTEVDIEKSPVGRKQYEAAGGKGSVPLIDINGDVIHGFDQAALKKALQL